MQRFLKTAGRVISKMLKENWFLAIIISLLLFDVIDLITYLGLFIGYNIPKFYDIFRGIRDPDRDLRMLEQLHELNMEHVRLLMAKDDSLEKSFKSWKNYLRQ